MKRTSLLSVKMHRLHKEKHITKSYAGRIVHKLLDNMLVQVYAPPLSGFFQMRSLKIILLSVCSLLLDYMYHHNELRVNVRVLLSSQ